MAPCWLLPAVGGGLAAGKGAILKGDGDDVGIRVEFSVIDAGHEEAPVALDVVLLHVGVLETEVDRHAIGGLPVVVVEMLVGLDVVLIAVGPVEIDLLSVVGNGVSLVAGVAALGDEVAFGVVAAEKRPQEVMP